MSLVRLSFVVALILFGCACSDVLQLECVGDDVLGEVLTSHDSFVSNSPGVYPADSGPLWPRTWDFGEGYTFKLRGRVDTDAIWSSQSAANTATFGDLADVVGLRRARIGAEGELREARRYVAEIDLATGFVVPRGRDGVARRSADRN